MLRLPRSFPSLALACAFTVPLVNVSLTFAQTSPAPQAASQQGTAVYQAADDFWHYAKVARYDLANAAAQKVLTQYKSQPADVLKAFQQVSSDRQDNLDQWLLRWQQVPQLTDNVNKLIDLLNKGRYTHRSDVRYIQTQIERLATNERGYMLGVQQLRESGELAVPVMLDYLRDTSKQQYRPAIRRALVDMGREALNPLIAATEMKDTDTLIDVVDALGSIGYDASVPYLLRLANNKNEPAAVQTAATQALVRMGVQNPHSLNAAEAFYDLAEKFYYDQAAVVAPQGQKVAYVWYWDQQNGLTKKNVPAPIFNEIMAMRESEYALKLDPNMGKAVSLWLASDFKREAELPQGENDPTRLPNQPDAHYYAVASGTQFVNPVLSRALRDHNAPVAFKAIKALEVTAGSSTLFTGGAGQPMIDALNFPDRIIRFEAAYALGSAMPQQDFQGKDRAVQLLADALNQTGKQNVLAVLPSQNDVNTLSEQLNGQFTVVGATSVNAALEQAQKLPSVDYLVVSEDLPQEQVDRLFDAANASPRLDGAARVILTHTPASRYAQMTLSNPMISISQAAPNDAAGVKAAIQAAQKKSGMLTLDQQMANENALRSAQLLAKLAITRGQVLDLNIAVPALLDALNSPNADLDRAAGEALAQLNSKDVQSGLANKALNDQTPDELKIAFLHDLATNAKFYGNQLEGDATSALEKAVHDAGNLQVRSAAAEARGALNLPADQAKKLILEQSRV